MRKLFLLILIAAAVYFVYKLMFEPMLNTGKGRVGNFYGNVSTPKIE